MLRHEPSWQRSCWLSESRCAEPCSLAAPEPEQKGQGVWCKEQNTSSLIPELEVHRSSHYFAVEAPARSVRINSRDGLPLQSRGPTTNATARPSRPMRKVVGNPI